MKQSAKNKINESNILVIIYEQVIRDLLIRTLISDGHKVTASSLGSDGIKRLTKENGKRFNLVIIDTLLPKLNSLGIIEKIKKIRSKTPIILINGSNDKSDTINLIKSQVDYFIKRPLNLDKILDLVNTVAATTI